VSNLRVPMDRDQFEAVLEAAYQSADSDAVPTKLLIGLGLSWLVSEAEGLEWTVEQEKP
jgi:hypothetical protein